MQIENITIKPVDDNDIPVHLKPTLKIEFEILDLLPFAIVVDVYGDLRINNTIISRIFRYNISAMDKPARQDYVDKGKDFLAQGYAEFDKESLDFIEKSRGVDKYNDVNFSASVTFSVLWKNKNGFLEGYQQYVRELPGESTIIKASDWVNKFVPKLGVRNFLVLEIPFYKESDNNIIKAALYLLGEAEKAYQGWDATTTFVKCRQVVEKLRNKVHNSSLNVDEKEKFDRLVAKGDKGLFGFLSFGIHEDTNNTDGYAHRIITQYDAEAALYFTKILIKYTAELLKENIVK